MPSRSSRVPYIVALVWLVFTVSLASWWLSVGLTLTDRYRMFVWEGGAFIALLVGGGAAIVLAIRREQARRETIETFFMSFTHDLKTSLARVQLQAEGLREDLVDSAARGPLDRLLHDTVRLQIQLENSLYVAQPDGRLLRERIDAAARCQRLGEDWPDLQVAVTGTGDVLADARAFDTVLRNLLQNAVVHGLTDRVDIQISDAPDGAVRLVIADRGRGVAPELLPRLGELFARPTDTSGTGAGLYVSRRLVARMGGKLSFESAAPGLRAIIDLPGTGR